MCDIPGRVFRGHFPQKAVMPGVLILEALAQVGAVAILSVPQNQGKIAFFGGIQKCRFKGMVFPGEQTETGDKDHPAERSCGSRRSSGFCGWKCGGAQN